MEYPHASEEIVRLYNEFRSNIVLLQDLKTAVHNTEYQLDQLALRLKVEKEIVSLFGGLNIKLINFEGCARRNPLSC